MKLKITYHCRNCGADFASKTAYHVNCLGEIVATCDYCYDGAPDAGQQSIGFGKTEDEALANLIEHHGIKTGVKVAS